MGHKSRPIGSFWGSCLKKCTNRIIITPKSLHCGNKKCWKFSQFEEANGRKKEEKKERDI